MNDKKVVVNSTIKGTLEFDLSDGFVKKEYLRALKADNAFRALHDIDNRLREYERYKIVSGAKLDFELASSMLGTETVTVTEENQEDLANLLYGIRREIASIIADSGINMSEDYD